MTDQPEVAAAQWVPKCILKATPRAPGNSSHALGTHHCSKSFMVTSSLNLYTPSRQELLLLFPFFLDEETEAQGLSNMLQASPWELVLWAGPPLPHLLAPSSMLSPS